MIAKILIALGALAAFAALVVALAEIPTPIRHRPPTRHRGCARTSPTTS